MEDAVTKEIITRVEAMPEHTRKLVLRIVTSLMPRPVTGTPGHALKDLAGTLDDASGQEMIDIIKRDCENIDEEP